MFDSCFLLSFFRVFLLDFNILSQFFWFFFAFWIYDSHIEITQQNTLSGSDNNEIKITTRKKKREKRKLFNKIYEKFTSRYLSFRFRHCSLRWAGERVNGSQPNIECCAHNVDNGFVTRLQLKILFLLIFIFITALLFKWRKAEKKFIFKCRRRKAEGKEASKNKIISKNCNSVLDYYYDTSGVFFLDSVQ